MIQVIQINRTTNKGNEKETIYNTVCVLGLKVHLFY